MTAWKYDNEGVQSIELSDIREELEGDQDGKIIDCAYEEACLYSFNQKDKKAKVMWTYLGVSFLSGELKSYQVATEYDIVSEKSGQDSFVLNRTVQSERKAFRAV